MPEIGMFHRTVFETSSLRILNFSNYKRKTETKIATHDIINHKSKIEVVGFTPVEISMQILLHGNLLAFRYSVDVWQDLRRLREDCEDAVQDWLIVGQEILGKFMIKSINENVIAWSKLGNPLVIKADVVFVEVDGSPEMRWPPRDTNFSDYYEPPNYD